MEEFLKDERFSSIITDPKFRNVPKSHRKVKIDKRFQSMFTDKNFQLKYTVDKRGRPIRETQAENFRKYYDLSSSEEEGNESNNEPLTDDSKLKREDEDEEEIKSSELVASAEDKTAEGDAESKDTDRLETGNDTSRPTAPLETSSGTEHLIQETKQGSDILENVDEIDEIHKSKIDDKVRSRLQDMSLDYARGIGVLQSDSSSDESSSEDSESEAIEHPWGELDRDAIMVNDVTPRLAVCHMDWDRITATDLMVLFNSFLPAGGIIQSIAIYPSEFGLERMKEEELQGPKELTEKKGIVGHFEDSDKDDEEEGLEGGGYHMEKLREYQLKRLKYFYAVVTCNNAETANKLYSECDGMEYESSATRLDLRFIPDDMTFDQDPRETCTSMPDIVKYQPRLFANTALQQGKVDLTWDETDPKRLDLTKKFKAGEELQDDDLRAYIATSSEEEHSDNNGGNSKEVESEEEGSTFGENDKISKYRSLLANIHSEKEKKEKADVQMEISWDVGLQDKAKDLVDQKKKDKLTPFEKIIENKKERRKQKFGSSNKKDDDDLYSDQDVPSGFSSDDEIIKDLTEDKKSKKNRKESDTSEDENDDRKKAELELLLAENEEEGKQHFSLKGIQEQENVGKKKKKWKKQLKKKETVQQEDNFQIDVKDERFSALYTSHYYNIDPADPHFRKTKAMEKLITEKQKRKSSTLENQKMVSVEEKKPRMEERSMDPELYKLVTSVKRKTKGH